MKRSRLAFVVLLLLPIAVSVFSAYEMHALDFLPGWHTISYDAQRNALLFWSIMLMFGITAAIAMVWWWNHIRGGRIIPQTRPWTWDVDHGWTYKPQPARMSELTLLLTAGMAFLGMAVGVAGVAAWLLRFF